MKYSFPNDYYGYKPIGNSFCIEGKDGDMLIGDKWPATEELAIQYCRVANIAYKQGRKDLMEEFKENFKNLLK